MKEGRKRSTRRKPLATSFSSHTSHKIMCIPAEQVATAMHIRYTPWDLRLWWPPHTGKPGNHCLHCWLDHSLVTAHQRYRYQNHPLHAFATSVWGSLCAYTFYEHVYNHTDTDTYRHTHIYSNCVLMYTQMWKVKKKEEKRLGAEFKTINQSVWKN